MGGTGWGGVVSNFVGLHSLGFTSGTTHMYVGIGPYFGDSL